MNPNIQRSIGFRRAAIPLSLAGVVLAIGGLLIFNAEWGIAQGKKAPTAQDRDLVTVDKVDYPVLIAASGVLEAEKNISIGPPKITAGGRGGGGDRDNYRLLRIVEDGKEVTEGDFLMEFEGSSINSRMRDVAGYLQRMQQEYQKKRSDFEVQMSQQRLNLEQAKADLEKLSNKLSQQEELESRIVVEETKLQRDQAQLKYDLLQKQVRLLDESGRINLAISRSNENNYRSRIDQLQDSMDALVVRAPSSGVVILRKDWNGEAKQVGNNINAREVVIDLPDLKTLRIKAMVDEVDAGKVRVGQPARITVDAVQGRVFEGVIGSISGILRLATFNRPQKIVDVFIKLTSSDLSRMRPGMSAKSQIEVDRYNGVLVVPISSIMERDGRSFVQLVDGATGKPELREIRIRTSDGLTAVVESGLKEGDKIRSKPKLT
jgi:HlyD family secretion protein